MRVVLSTFGSRGDIEPFAGLAVALRELGAESVVCASPDVEFVERLAGFGVPLVPAGPSVRELVTGPPVPPKNLPERAAEILRTQYDAVIEAAEGGSVVVGTGLFPATAGAQIAAERLGLPFVLAAFQPTTLPSPVRPPHPRPGRPLPPEITDNRALWEYDAETMNVLFGPAINELRTSLGLPALDAVRDHVYTDRPLLATDPVLDPWHPTDLDVVQTGAWLAPDDRPLPPGLSAFLDAGDPPVYVGFGSMPLKASRGSGLAAVEAARALGHRVVVAQGWADLAAAGDGCFAVGEVNQQALFRRVSAVVHHGGAGTTTTAARA
ncbi:glycosyltransferase, partial [Actinocorallia lasiicapitis]